MLLHEPRLKPAPRRDGRNLAGMVALHAADGDQRVAALGERVCEQVL
jgi:hypothetical protein